MPFPENTIRIDGLAGPRKKVRRKGLTWYQIWINEKEYMRCVETRRSRHADHVGAIFKGDPDISIDIPIHEFNAYMVKYNNYQPGHKPLFDLLLKIICALCVEERWAFVPNKNNPQLECLANLVLHEYISPAAFNKRNTEKRVFSISALAKVMHMDRKTYNAHWHKRFLALRPIIKKWGDSGYTKFKYR